LGLTFLAAGLLPVHGGEAGEPCGVPAVGDTFRGVQLPVPEDPEHAAYLGLEGRKGTFELEDIPAELVVVEIFSMYCPYCQREAAAVNELYERVEKSPETKGKIKLIGIGAGNSSFEVEVFRKNYRVPFPLISDDDFRLHKAFGETRTPYFFVVKRRADDSRVVTYSKAGTLGPPARFLDTLRRELTP